MRVQWPSIATLVLAAGVAGSPLPAAAQDDAARVKVKLPWLASDHGDPVEGAVLRLTDLASGESRSVTTGPDGSFVLGEVDPGPYRLHLAAPTGARPDEAVSLVLSRRPGTAPPTRARKPREIVVVGIAEQPPGEGRIPAHTPEWTDFGDHDPGVAPAGHDDWIEAVVPRSTEKGEILILTVPPPRGRAPEEARYFDLHVGDAGPLEGGVVFGDGIRGARLPAGKAVLPARPIEREEPDEPDGPDEPDEPDRP